MTTNLDQAMLQVLQMIATPDEINMFALILDGISHGRVEAWYAAFLYEIVRRLSEFELAHQPSSK